MLYYCSQHEIAYPMPNQWKGHWMNAHRGEQRPKVEDVATEAVPEGTRVSPPPNPSANHRPSATPIAADNEVPIVRDSQPASTVLPGVGQVDEETARLNRLLIGIAVPLPQRQSILTGFQSFEILRQHPTNLTNFLVTHIPTKLRNLVPMVVHEMFPLPPQEEAGAGFIYPGWNQGPFMAPMHQPWQNQYQPRYEPFLPPYYETRHVAPREEPKGDDPIVTALQQQVQGLMDELQQERKERAEKERQALLDSRFEKLEDSIQDIADQLVEVTNLFQEDSLKGRTSAEASAMEKVQTEVTTLRQELAAEKAQTFQASLDALREDKAKQEVAMAELRTIVASGQVGKTTEDIISQVAPLVLDKVEAAGDKMMGEMAELRNTISQGKMPELKFPNAQGSAADPIENALEFARTRALEDDILQAVDEGVH